MNERDSERIRCMLGEQGYQQTFCEEEADVLIFNTCSVREKAEDKVIGKVGALRRLKRNAEQAPVIGIVGCMAQNLGRQLLSTLNHVDFVVGTDQLNQIPYIIGEVAAGNGPVVAVDRSDSLVNAASSREEGQISAYVSVMRGCNQFCSYCIVPHVRGREKSRPIPEVVQEVEELVQGGVREIYLLGQSITGYGVVEKRQGRADFADCGERPFADLLKAVHEVPGVERIRFTSPHPKFIDDSVIDAMVNLPKVCNAFHIPLQSGSNRILERMRRGYTAEMFLSIVSRIRGAVPECTFSTDVMVGFPGETEQDFGATREIMEQAAFEMAYIFKYSPRSGTEAAALEDDVPQEEKERRNQVLLADLEGRSERLNRQIIGRRVQVLVDGPSPKNPARWKGRSRQNKVCLFEPTEDLQRGAVVEMTVYDATASALYARVPSTVPAA